MTDHTVHAFDVELKAISEQLDSLGRAVEQQLGDAMQALQAGDAVLATRVIEGDAALDMVTEQIEADAISLIARRQPLAVDLRHIMAAMRTAWNLERAGDLARNIAKRAIAMMPAKPSAELGPRLAELATSVMQQLSQTREAVLSRDAELARSVWERDAAIDALHTALFRDIVSTMAVAQAHTLELTHLLFVAKNLERIGDHATNIAENVVYLVHGAAPEEQRPKLDDSSTLSTLIRD